jgi:DNA-binding PucR family transcriptional regulator
MREYDKNHNTQYVLTLKTYIDQKFNATHAAKKMFIHRTTLLERLNKISTFINMDLDDPRNCLYLMIALVLLDH